MSLVDFTDPARMRLDVEFYFAAAHRLPRYEGPCFRLHGHNYKLFVAVEGETDPHAGMVADFGVIQKVVHETILMKVDHRNLNDFMENPTAENIARWFWELLRPQLDAQRCKLVEIRLYEVPEACVTYRGPAK